MMHSEIYRDHTIVVFGNGYSLVHRGAHAPADTKGAILAECESTIGARLWVDNFVMLTRRAATREVSGDRT